MARGRSTGSIDRQRVLLSGNGLSRPGGRPAESYCSLFPGPVDRAVDQWLNGHKNDRWPVDRPIDRKEKLPFAAASGQIWFWAINTHFFGLF